MSEALEPRPFDPDSVGELWRDLHGRVRQEFGSADRADDIVQETFLSALRRPPPDPRGLAAWMRVVARHVALRSRKRERNRGARERAVARATPGWTAAPEESASEAREALRLLAALDQPYREVLQLRFLQGLETEEIARHLRRSPATVRSQIKRGLDRIRVRLGAPATRRERPWAFVPFVGAWRERAPAWLGPSAAGLGAAAVCAWLLLGSRTPDSAVLARTGPAALPAGPALAPFDWRTQENRERVQLAPWIPTEAVQADSSEAWPTDVHGVVRDVEGRPTSGVAVHVGRENGAEGRLVTRSDAFGRFRVEGADGRRWIWAEGAGCVPSSRHLVASVDPALELELRLGAPLEATLGRVLTAARVPVSGAEVTLSGQAFRAGNPEVGVQGTLELPPSPVTVVSDAEGYFRLGSPPGALARLDVLALGEPPVARNLRAPAAGEVLELVLPAGATLSGRVLASDGTPAAWTPLRLVLPGLLPEQETITDGTGHFRLGQIPPGPFELVLAGEPLHDSSSLHLAGVMEEGEQREVEPSCAPEHTLHGVAARGETPLVDWIVELQRIRTDLFPEMRSTRTDDQGRFTFASCAPSSHYRLRLTDPSTHTVVSVQKVPAGGGEVRLAPKESIERLARLRGALRSDDPAFPVVFAELWSDGLGQRWTARVDPTTGKFSFPDLPPASYRLRAWRRGCGPVHVGDYALEPGQATKLDRHLERPGAWHLRLGLPAGVSAERVCVLLSVHSLHAPNPGTQRRLELDAENAVQAELQPGTYEYSVLVDGVLLERRTLTLASGPRSEELVIPPFVRVTLAVRPPRTLGEREAIVAEVEAPGTDARRIPLARGLNRAENRFEVFVPPDTRRIRLEAGQALAGEWCADARLEPGQVLSIALEATDE